jgi:hypothetical protein
MKLKKLLLIGLLIPATLQAQNCSIILKQASGHFINTQSEKNGGSTLAIVKAIHTYKSCYQARIEATQKQLAVSGRGPLMGAQGNFKDMESALKQLTDYALKVTATGGSYDQIKVAYTKLYALQFKNAFYQSYLVSKKQKVDSAQLYQAQNRFHKMILNYSKDEQIQLEQLFDVFETSLAQGLNLSPYPAYIYAMTILQSPASSTVINPVF